MSRSILLAAIAAFSLGASAQVSLTAPGVAVVQNFDSLASTGTAATLPTGWALAESGTNANATYTAGTGSANGGDSYSFGAAAALERALGGVQSGSLVPSFGAQLQNNTGTAITGLQISYVGEQWRLGTAARPDQLLFEYSLDATSLITGTWNAVAALDFTGPIQAGAVGALDGNLAANQQARTAIIPALNVATGASVWIRWRDFNSTGADDGLAIDDVSVTPQGSASSLSASVNDVSLAEGNAGSTNATFTVTLTGAATGTEIISFQTSAGTATAGSDYTETAATLAFSAGQTSRTVNVPVIGDTTAEPNETFNVTLTLGAGSTGAVIGDGAGIGTITNDDFTITPINQIQGAGLVSPLANGTSVTTTGIVTGIKTNGFFIQSATADANPATSEGILVFTGAGAVPASVVLGASLQVTGNVLEFIPTTDLFQPPTTELVAPLTVTQISTGNPLPAPIAITAINPAGDNNQLENLEHMRVSFTGLSVIAGTRGFKNEANATGSTNGIFWATLPGAARPKREPGIDVRETLIAGVPAGVPRFDGNPEALRVDSDGLVSAPALDLVSGQNIGAIIGVLDYGVRFYTFLPDPGQSPTISPAPAATLAAPAGSAEFTIASYNLERFFDDVNDPATSDVALTPAAYANRLSKASLQIRTNLGAPDIVSVIEMENLTTLQALAAKITADGGPTYSPFLAEGNDPGGIDVGFLVKTGVVTGTTARVSNITTTQVGLTATYINPITSAAELLNDRPPLVLTATVNSATGGQANVTVIVNHLRSFLGITDPVDGVRIRAKRLAQAEFVANLVQARQVADPAERIVVLGDFNAYEFNDGYVDSIGSIIGQPTPATQVLLAGADLVNPNLTRLIDAAADYSYSFDGFTQNIDHVMVSQGLINNSSARSLTHVKFNADYPEVARSNYAAGADTRLSDHDALVLRVSVPALGIANTTTALVSSLNPSTLGANVTFTASVTGNAPTGNVRFLRNATVIGNGNLSGTGNTRQATFATNSLLVGTSGITAVYDGDVQNLTSTSTLLNQVVGAGATTTTLGSTPNPSVFSAAVQLTAQVSGAAPSGTVNFTQGATVLGSAPLVSGIASITISQLPVGTTPITAMYSGDTANLASASSVLNQVVTAAATTTALSANPNPFGPGQAVTLTAIVSPVSPAVGPITGNVNFFNGTQLIGTAPLVNGQAVFSAALTGAGNITAQFAGSTSFAASTSAALALARIQVPVPTLGTLSLSILIGLMITLGLMGLRDRKVQR